MKTVKESRLGELTLRVVEHGGRLVGIVLGGTKPTERIEGEVFDDVWRRLHDEAGKAHASYFGFDGARARFARFFPGGLASPAYMREERDYKLKAKAKLEALAPLDSAREASGLGEAVFQAYQATNLLSPFEMMRLREVLRGARADDFVRAAARMALGELSALLDIEKALKPNDAAKWTVATYLPFLWRPQMHMFLKPEVTKDFAERVGHPFAGVYEAASCFQDQGRQRHHS